MLAEAYDPRTEWDWRRTVLILPLIDLLILLGTGFLAIGGLLKVMYVATVYRWTPVGFTPMDFATLAIVCWVLALVLAARTWVKVNEPALHAVRRQQIQAVGRREARRFDSELGRDYDAPEQEVAAEVQPLRPTSG
jgi:hypothetical protein